MKKTYEYRSYKKEGKPLGLCTKSLNELGAQGWRIKEFDGEEILLERETISGVSPEKSFFLWEELNKVKLNVKENGPRILEEENGHWFATFNIIGPNDREVELCTKLEVQCEFGGLEKYLVR